METSREFLTDLFTGKATRHGIIAQPAGIDRPFIGDVAVSEHPVSSWIPSLVASYEQMADYHETLGDDNVPYARVSTGTEIFAAAFGAPVHCYEDNNPAAMPFISTAEEADALEIPTLDAPPLRRIFEAGIMLREQVGVDVPIAVPDIQSPFDIAALIWRKEDFFIAMYESPDAVKRLVEKCSILLKSFLRVFMEEFPNCNLCHCPVAWAPPELGCWLSEDESGSMNVAMFDEFCLPSLVDFSNTFGGLFMHCCATADHQYASFNKIPNLRGLNRVFQDPGPGPAIKAFAGKTVLINAWFEEDYNFNILDLAEPDSRFLFNIRGLPLEESKVAYERLRERALGQS